MYTRLLAFLKMNDMFFSQQFGFRGKHSTYHAILMIIDKVQIAMIDNNEFFSGVFLDFSKAFNTVNHNILVDKLEFYGIRGIANDGFISYISNSRQFASLGQTNSELQHMSCGVSHGSVLEGHYYFSFILMILVTIPFF